MATTSCLPWLEGLAATTVEEDEEVPRVSDLEVLALAQLLVELDWARSELGRVPLALAQLLVELDWARSELGRVPQ